MKAPVVEIFKSIQGEGLFTGVPMLFVRFAGCNLRCEFCDTKKAWESEEEPELGHLTAEEIVERAMSAGLSVCLTGGEPLLHMAVVSELIYMLLELRCSVHIETNGTLSLGSIPKSPGLFVTVSPKDASLRIEWCSQVKHLFKIGDDPKEAYWTYRQRFGDVLYYLQPLDDGNMIENAKAAVAYAVEHPHWRVSCQVHKLIGVA